MWIICLAIFLLLALLLLCFIIHRKVFYVAPGAHTDPDSYKARKFFQPYKEFLIPLIDTLKTAPREDLWITAKDGVKLHAAYHHRKDGAPIAVFFHGFKGSAQGSGCGAWKISEEQGYNLLMADHRACGQSGGTAVTFGIKEREDCLLWLRYLAERFGKDTPVYLLGISMGGATVLMASAMDLPENVKAVVSDCAYCSAKEIILSVAADKGLPGKLLYPFVRLSARLFAGFDPEADSPLEAVRRAKVPILFIHGEEDTFVPFPMVYRLYEACAGEKMLFTVPGAVHVTSYPQDPEGYKAAVLNLIRSVSPSSSAN